MPHFAQINENNEVVQVLVVTQEYIDMGRLGDPSKWIQTSYNTQAGKPVSYTHLPLPTTPYV